MPRKSARKFFRINFLSAGVYLFLVFLIPVVFYFGVIQNQNLVNRASFEPPQTTSQLTPTVSTGNPTGIAAIIFKLTGVDKTDDPIINSYRSLNSIPTAVKLQNKTNPDLQAEFSSIAAHYDPTTGKYRADLSGVPVDLMKGVIIYLKPERFLQFKFCLIEQTGVCSESDEKNLFAGFNLEQPVDLSRRPLLPGDFDNNGAINGADTSLMLKELDKPATDRDLKFDLNFDHLVSGIDYSLMLASMQNFYEDEN